MRAIVFALCLVLTATASAQTLTKEEEGRVAIGQCYRACMTDNLADDRLAVVHLMDQLWENYRESTLSQEEWSLFVNEFETITCTLLQSRFLEAYTCLWGCRDVEVAYGVKISSARNVFYRAYNRAKSDLQSSGLWVTDDRDYPEVGTPEFTAACDNLFDATAAGESTPLSGIIPPGGLDRLKIE